MVWGLLWGEKQPWMVCLLRTGDFLTWPAHCCLSSRHCPGKEITRAVSNLPSEDQKEISHTLYTFQSSDPFSSATHQILLDQLGSEDNAAVLCTENPFRQVLCTNVFFFSWDSRETPYSTVRGHFYYLLFQLSAAYRHSLHMAPNNEIAYCYYTLWFPYLN